MHPSHHCHISFLPIFSTCTLSPLFNSNPSFPHASSFSSIWTHFLSLHLSAPHPNASLTNAHATCVNATPQQEALGAVLFKLISNLISLIGEEGPGWSTTWKAASWARLHNSERAYQMIKHLFDLVDPENESNYEGGLYSNMFTAHPPFQIDANFGFSAAVAEMLIQSSVTDIYLIPALPRDKWRNGSVEGLKARGNVTVSISWSDGDLHELRLWSDNRENQRFTKTIHYNDMSVVATMLTGIVYTFDGKLKTVKTASL
ncbi:putative alpha-L-fucosidase [Helianthus debilis subsp. tardiflorus]